MTTATAMTATDRLGWPSGPERPELPRGEVHVWGARIDPTTDTNGLLSSGERERASRFRFERDRIRWSGAHALLNSVLARYLRCAPGDVLLKTAGAREKPSIRRPRRSSWLQFNLSHAADIALVAVANRRAVGIDVEVVDDRKDHLAVARRVLPEAIRRELGAVAPEARAELFFREWVRHEARGKCLGIGVVEPDEDPGITVAIVDVALGPGVAGALAVRSQPTNVRWWSLALAQRWSMRYSPFARDST